jgi:Phycobilisome Linker polypeptide
MTPVPAFATPAALPLRAAASLRAAPTVPLRAPAARAAVSGACAARMAFSSIQGVLTANPVALPTDANSVVAAMYKQMFGNAYLMESELAELAVAESMFRISRDTKEFVRAIGYSEAYKSRFFDPVSQYRFIELAYKHMLGRAPRNLADYGAAMAAYHEDGVRGVVDWCVDSAEFEEAFGSETVPYGEYKGCYPTNEEFNRSVAIRGTPSSSDKKRSTMLQYAVCSGDSPSWLTISKNLVPGTERGTGFCVGGHWTSTQRNKKAPVRVGTKIPGGVVFYG